MHRLTIHIAPHLLEEFGPEISYAWRSLLSGIGYAWHLVAADTPADIAYTPAPDTPARIWIRADLRRWRHMPEYHPAALGGAGGWIWPRYVGDAPDEAPQLIDGNLHIRRDLLFDLFWLLSGVDEQNWPRNPHGHLDLSGSAWLNDHMLRAGPASAIGSQLERALGDLATPPPLARWPHHKRAAAAAGHDVDYPEA
ncbi:MAG: hypothetical protein HC822_21810, partial [Oscillochloris sp.]|nr:hypothetical protein [Oscillochloris sp.]